MGFATRTKIIDKNLHFSHFDHLFLLKDGIISVTVLGRGISVDLGLASVRPLPKRLTMT